MEKFIGTETPSEFIKHNLVVGILANNRIKDQIADGYLKNLTEFYTQEFFLGGLTVIYGENPEDLMAQTSELGKSHLVALKVGNITTSFLDTLINFFERFYDDEVLIGHILDRGDSYYEIHPQFFLIDIKWWESVGKPMFGIRRHNTEWEATIPERSNDNWHDDYTPKWIKNGSTKRTYTSKEYGWNIISLALDSGKKVGVWQKYMRDSKKYLYPEVEEAYAGNINEVLRLLDTSKFFCSNTEDIHVSGNIVADTVICTAGGPSPILHAFAYNMKSGGNLVVVDVSELALNIMQDMFATWDGRDYHSWLEEYRKNSSAIRGRMIAFERVEKQSKWMDEIPGFEEWYNEVWPHINKQFIKQSILDVDQFTKRIDSFFQPGNIVVVHTSNIFHYLPTSLFYNYNIRWHLFWKLKNYVTRKQATVEGLKVIQRILFNDHHRKIMEILPWYKKID